MKNIKLKDIDSLDEILRNINIYTYFLTLVEYDKEEHIVPYEDINTIQQSAENFLSENISEEVNKMNEIVNKENFLL